MHAPDVLWWNIAFASASASASTGLETRAGEWLSNDLKAHHGAARFVAREAFAEPSRGSDRNELERAISRFEEFNIERTEL